jgi:uncharacterized membrane protein YbhN (UPF0104 family)
VSATAGAVAPSPAPSRARRILKVLAWLAGVAILVVVLDLAGVDVTGWFSQLWDAITEISGWYIALGLVFQTIQTSLTALAWLFILRAAYPEADIPFRSILAAYAAGVAMNGFLPANIGTLASLLMFAALIEGANFAGVIGGMVVQKIFFSAVGTAVYIYLFLSVPGSASLQLGNVTNNWVWWLVIGGGTVVLIVILCRRFWPKLKKQWENAKEGGAILARPRDYFIRVFAPSLGAWLSKLGVIAVFLAAYGIPVTFHTVMSIVGGNSLANTVSATPGGVGVNQAVNVASLHGVTDSATATAYSAGQQLIVTVWNVIFGVVLVVWAFGVAGGKTLVEGSYEDAKVKVAEQKAARDAKKAAKRAEHDHDHEHDPEDELAQ